MLLPVRPVASAVLRDLGENEFGGQFALGEMGGDSLLRLFRRDLRVQKHEHRRTRSAQASAENARISDQFLDRRKQWTKRRAIGLMDTVFERRGKQIGPVLRNAANSSMEF